MSGSTGALVSLIMGIPVGGEVVLTASSDCNSSHSLLLWELIGSADHYITVKFIHCVH